MLVEYNTAHRRYPSTTVPAANHTPCRRCTLSSDSSLRPTKNTVKKRKTNRVVVSATAAIRPPVNTVAYCGSQVRKAARIQIRLKTDPRTVDPAVHNRRKANDVPEALALPQWYSIQRTMSVPA